MPSRSGTERRPIHNPRGLELRRGLELTQSPHHAAPTLYPAYPGAQIVGTFLSMCGDDSGEAWFMPADVDPHPWRTV